MRESSTECRLLSWETRELIGEEILGKEYWGAVTTRIQEPADGVILLVPKLKCWRIKG
ncbi:hypothetical protein LINGRAHAP2_LOCUS7871 [Linum grandiflorum]